MTPIISLTIPVSAPAKGPKSIPDKMIGRFPKPSLTVFSIIITEKNLVRTIFKAQKIEARTSFFVLSLLELAREALKVTSF